MQIREQIVREAMRWHGTPYHHCADVMGAGVDCAMILVRVYAACGLIPQDFDPRPYAPQWNLHQSEELYQRWIDAAGAKPTGSPRMGDVGLWKFGRTYSHAAILLDERTVIHALQSAGKVVIGGIDEGHLQGRQCKFYSVVGAS